MVEVIKVDTVLYRHNATPDTWNCATAMLTVSCDQYTVARRVLIA